MRKYYVWDGKAYIRRDFSEWEYRKRIDITLNIENHFDTTCIGLSYKKCLINIIIWKLIEIVTIKIY